MLGADGEKYACEACIRGHRVSNCNHADRELKHIAKKGRPVTQCVHCRSLRKSRSAHVKCDCGEKQHAPKEKCCHLKQAQNPTTGALGSTLEHHSSEEHCCHCHHGERCSCAIKKESTDLPAVAEDHVMPLPVARARPKLFGAHTDNSLMVVNNGYHKPIHRNNNAAHECGMPYKIPPHHHGSGHGPHGIGHRSSDSLPLNFSADRNTPTPEFNSVRDDTSQIQSISTPVASTPGDFGASPTTSSPFASLGMGQGGPVDAFPESWSNTTSQRTDVDMSLGSANSEFPPTLWSGNDLPLHAVSNASQPPSWTSESNGLFPQPALTAASSSEPQSEVDESMPVTLDELCTPLTGMSNNNTTKDQLVSATSQPFVTDEPFPNFDLKFGNENNDKSSNRWSMPIGNFNFDAMQQGYTGDFRRPSTHVRSGSNPVPPARPASIHALDQFDAKSAPTSNPGFTSSNNNNNWLAQLGLDIPSSTAYPPTNGFTGLDLNDASPQLGKLDNTDEEYGARPINFTTSTDFGSTTVTDDPFPFDSSSLNGGSYSNDGWVS